LSIALVLCGNEADSGCESHDSSGETHLKYGDEGVDMFVMFDLVEAVEEQAISKRSWDG
jgi:hypothetical protein